MAKADKEINQLREENQNLHKYVEELGQHVSFSNSGKTFTESKRKAQGVENTVAIDILGGKRSLVKNIIAQTTILKRAIKK